MTANRTVRTGLTASAVISVRTPPGHFHFDLDDSTLTVTSPGSGLLPFWARRSQATTMVFRDPSGSLRAAVP